jgi:hypothetical protein
VQYMTPSRLITFHQPESQPKKVAWSRCCFQN